METMLDLPTITGLPTDPVSTAIAAQAKPAAPTATLKETALASFVPIEQHMRTLAARYKDVAYDVTTTKGMNEAKAARLVLRDEGRYAVQRLVKRVKDEANDLKKTIDARGDEVIAITQDIEAAIDGQITAEETRKAAEKAERDRIERERVAALEARLAGLSVWIDRCKVPGITSERIRNGIAMLEQAPIGDDWAEYRDRAIERRAEILGVMQSLYQQHLISEVEARRLEEQRAEAARIEAALAARKAELDAQAAELLRREEEIRAAEKAMEDVLRQEEEDALVASMHANSRRIEFYSVSYVQKAICTFETAAKDWESDHRPRVREAVAEGRRHLAAVLAQAMDAERSATAPAAGPTAPWGAVRDFIDDAGEPTDTTGEPVDQTDAEIAAANGPEVDPFPAPAVESDSTPPAVVEPATLKIGTICTRLGFTLTAAFLHGKGIEPAGRDKAAVLYRESQWPGIKAALIRHIEAA